MILWHRISWDSIFCASQCICSMCLLLVVGKKASTVKSIGPLGMISFEWTTFHQCDLSGNHYDMWLTECSGLWHILVFKHFKCPLLSGRVIVWWVEKAPTVLMLTVQTLNSNMAYKLSPKLNIQPWFTENQKMKQMELFITVHYLESK